MAKKYPFDLPASTYHIIEITPEITGLMAGGDEIEQQAVALILERWQDPDPFGLKILRKFGLSAPESKKIADTSAHQRKLAAITMDIVGKVAKKQCEKISGASGDDISEELFEEQFELVQIGINQSQNGIAPLWMVEYIDDFSALRDLPTIDTNSRLTSIVIQRSIPLWTDELTESLHSSIRQQLTDFIALELPAVDQKKSDPSLT